MAPIRLPCLMGSKCEFQTVELEYGKAKHQLDGHMEYAHGAAEEYTRAGPDLILIRQLRQQLTSLDETVKAIEAKESGKMAQETVRVFEASPAPEATAITTTSATSRTSSALRSSREKQNPVWNKVCRKRRRNKAIVDANNEDGARSDSVSLGEMAGLMYCLAKVSRDVDRVNKMKVPHMLHEQLEWVIKHPPPQPCIRLSVNIDTQSYRDNKVKPPSALKHRSADMTALADTGCQAVCMGPAQLTRTGLSINDLMEVDLRLSGANGSSIRILGGVFITITGEDSSAMWPRASAG